LFFKGFKKEINNSRSRAWGIGENSLFFRQTLIPLTSFPWDKKFPIVGKIDFFHFFTGGGGLRCVERSGSVVISTVCWVGFYVFSAAALCVVFVKSHKKAPVQGAVVDAVLMR
tara:strand:+ start:94 stop:432 length:339 start_codon:yes stop_codon:yes gene_type:complete